MTTRAFSIDALYEVDRQTIDVYHNGLFYRFRHVRDAMPGQFVYSKSNWFVETDYELEYLNYTTPLHLTRTKLQYESHHHDVVALKSKAAEMVGPSANSFIQLESYFTNTNRAILRTTYVIAPLPSAEDSVHIDEKLLSRQAWQEWAFLIRESYQMLTYANAKALWPEHYDIETFESKANYAAIEGLIESHGSLDGLLIPYYMGTTREWQCEYFDRHK